MKKRLLPLFVGLIAWHSSLVAAPELAPTFEDHGDWIILTSYDRFDFESEKKVKRETPTLLVLKKDTVVALSAAAS